MSKNMRAWSFVLALGIGLFFFAATGLGPPVASPMPEELGPRARMSAPKSSLPPEGITPEEQEQLIQEVMDNLWRHLPDLEPRRLEPIEPEEENGLIAYVGSDGYLHTMNPDGTGQQPIVTDLSNIADPAWSPDGRWLAVIADGGEGRCLYKIELATRVHTPLACGFIGLYSPWWSPGGNHITFVGTQVAGPFRSWAIDADGDVRVELAPSYYQVLTPRWFDNDTVMISGEQPNNVFRLYLVDLGTPDEPRAITPEFRCSSDCTCADSDVYLAYPHLSPDGTTISFVGGYTTGYSKTGCTGHYALYLVDPAGSTPPSKIADVADTSSGLALAGPSLWAPDNVRVGLHASGSDSVMRVNVVDTIAGTLQRLHGREGADWDGLTWAPDATQLATGYLPTEGPAEVDAVVPETDTFTILAEGDDPAWGTAPPGTPVDIEVTGLEVTQAIQHLEATQVPLVADKDTWVRVYARSSPADVPGAVARLYVVGGGEEEELLPANGTITVRTDGGKREEVDHTFNFLLPALAWPGTVTLRAEVQPGVGFYDENPANDAYPPYTEPGQEISFDETHPIAVHSWRFRVRFPDGTEHVVSHDEVLQLLDYTRRTFPVAGPEFVVLDRGEYPIDIGDYALKTVEGWRTLVGKLPCDFCEISSVARCFGWLPQAVRSYLGPIYGYAISPRAVATAGYDSLAAHELGHTFGLGESGCVRIDDYGFSGNEQTQTVYKPDVYYAFMNPTGACGMLTDYQWVSSVHYLAIKQRLTPQTSAMVGSVMADVTQPYLGVSGILSSSVEFGSLYTFTRTVGLSDDPGSGPYRLELEDDLGTILFTRYFTTGTAMAGETSNDAFFYEVMPRPAGVNRVVVWDGDTQLGSVEATLHAPEVEFLTALDGLVLGGDVELEWTASDADGDSLNYLVEYSADGGLSWAALAMNLIEPSVTIDADYLAGTTQGKIRVLASDGLNVGVGTHEGTFSVSNHPPEVTIVRPPDGTRVLPGVGINLVGYAYDREDGVLSDDQLTWLLDGMIPIGSGRQAYIPELECGRYAATLRATDSVGQSEEESVVLRVCGEIFLPLVMRQ